MALRRVLYVVFLWLVAVAGLPAHAETPDAALAKLIDEARAAAAVPGACEQPGHDRLVRIFCDGKIRVGVREYYPLFGTREGQVRSGYDVDVARALAKHLGVETVFTRVNAASRIPLLADDKIDLTIATMGHNTQRDGQVRFIRPHYYRSETIIVSRNGRMRQGEAKPRACSIRTPPARQAATASGPNVRSASAHVTSMP